MDFVFTRLAFTIRLAENIPDLFALYKMRNEFIRVFRATVCTGSGPCESCSERGDCAYHYTFSQELADDPSAVQRHQKPSLPFVFDLPVLPDPPNRAKEFELGLTLAGSAINYVEHYIDAVKIFFAANGAENTPSGTVIRVESQTCTGYRNCIMETGNRPALDDIATISALDLSEAKTLDPLAIRLELVTPLRIMQDGRLLREFSFALFIRSLLRRISSLAYYYYGTDLKINYKWLSSLSESITVDENSFRWSEWGGERGGERLSGLVGSGVCRGDLTDFHAFLLLGEYFHVGKGASFGFGNYRLVNAG